MNRILIAGLVVLASGLSSLSSTAIAQQPLVIKPLAEKRVAELPVGPLFWRIETFTALAQAQAAASGWSLIDESAGKIWLFTLGPARPGSHRRAGPRVRNLDRFPASSPPNISFGSTKPAVLQGALRPCIRIRAPRHSSCSPGSEASVVLTG